MRNWYVSVSFSRVLGRAACAAAVATIAAVFMAAALLVSCAPTAADQGQNWSPQSYTGATHMSVAFKDPPPPNTQTPGPDKNLVIIGKLGGSGSANDVWSIDAGVGSTLSKQASSGDLSSRLGATSTWFNNAAWVIGGIDPASRGFESELISSNVTAADVIDWVAKNTAGGGALPPRFGHATLVFQKKLWVIGGLGADGKYLNDVWSSSDGTTWTQVKPATSWKPPSLGGSPTDFPQRFAHAATVSPDGKMLISGGLFAGDYDGQRAMSYAFLSDMWSSTDGITWTEVTTKNTGSIPLANRAGHTITFFKNKLWAIGGFNALGTEPDSVWEMDPTGPKWRGYTPNDDNDLPGRFAHSVTVFDDKLWVAGGVDVRLTPDGNGGNKWRITALQDLWSSPDGKTWTQVK